MIDNLQLCSIFKLKKSIYSMNDVALSIIILYIRNNKLDSNKSSRPSLAMKFVVPDLVECNLFLLVNVEIVTLYFIRFEIYIPSCL